MPVIDRQVPTTELSSRGLLFLRGLYVPRSNDPYITQFSQPDSIIPDLYNPQALNRYSYVLNNPIRYNDPSGHKCVSAGPGDCLNSARRPINGSGNVANTSRSQSIIPTRTNGRGGGGGNGREGGSGGGNGGSPNRGPQDEFGDIQSTVFLPIEGGDAGKFTDVNWRNLKAGPWGLALLLAEIGYNITQFVQIYMHTPLGQEPSATTIVEYSKYADPSNGPTIGSVYTSIDYLTVANKFNEPINTILIEAVYDQKHIPDKFHLPLVQAIPPNSAEVWTHLGRVPDGIPISITITMYTENYYGSTTHVISP